MKKSWQWFFPVSALSLVFCLALSLYANGNSYAAVFIWICFCVLAVAISGAYTAGKDEGCGIFLSPGSLRPGRRFSIVGSAYNQVANVTYLKILVDKTFRICEVTGEISKSAEYVRVGFEGMAFPQPRFEVVCREDTSEYF